MKTREQWKALSPKKRVTLKPKAVKGICIHWGGVKAPKGGEATWRSYQNYHINTMGWYDIAYNFGVDLNGQIYEGRGMTIENGANGGIFLNRQYIAVCAIMGPSNSVTPELIEGLKKVIGMIRTHYPHATKLKGHRELKKATRCPGAELQNLIERGKLEPRVLPDVVPVKYEVLSKGSKGAEVKRLQKALRKIAVDGDFGPKTERRLIRIQKDLFPLLGKNLGTCNEATWNYVEWTEGLLSRK